MTPQRNTRPPPYLYTENLAKLPKALTVIPQWIVWRRGPTKPSGKFDKIPVGKNGSSGAWQQRQQWRPFDEAVDAACSGGYAGVGLVLPAQFPDGRWLVALDFDGVDLDAGKGTSRLQEIHQIHRDLGEPYIEESPSGNGLRMFVLSTERIPQLTRINPLGGTDEIFCASPKWATVTGKTLGGSGCPDATAAMQALLSKWGGNGHQPAEQTRAQSARADMLAHLTSTPTPELPIHVDRVKAQLAHVSPDCSYEQWRDVVWSVLSSGWDSAEGMAREWSQGAPSRFEERAFEQVCRSFDPTRGITLGTLDHHARQGGWQPDGADRIAAPRLLTRDDLQNLPPMQWLVRGVLPARGLAAVYGPSGSGKTFLALDLACSIAAGLSHWFGAKVKPAPVAYVALEGEAGIRARVTAWEKQHGRTAPGTARFVLGNFTLLKPAAAEELAAEILDKLGPGAVVFVDTLNQSAPGADENASADMGRVIANAKILADAVDGVVVLVHHAGKDASKGMRGHSSLFAAMDTVIEVSSSMTGRTWRLSKSKEGESGTEHGFELAPHVVGQDEDGADIRSCAVRPALLGTVGPVKPVRGKNQKAALAALARLAATHPDGIPMAAATAAVGAALDCDVHRRTARAAEVIKSLTESGHLQQDDGELHVLS